jgi:hypothetical protein
MAGQRVSRVSAWFEQESAGAPPVLRRRAALYLSRRPGTGDPAQELAAAAEDALRTSLAHSTGREAALDLLAADALVTLALKARAALDPGGLKDFAARLRAAGTGER